MKFVIEERWGTFTSERVRRKCFNEEDFWHCWPCPCAQGWRIIFLNSTLFSLSGQPHTSLRGDSQEPGKGNIKKHQEILSIQREYVPGPVNSAVTQFFDLAYCTSLEHFLSLQAAEEEAEEAGAGRDLLKATLLWQSPQLLIPDIYIGSTTTPLSEHGIHLPNFKCLQWFFSSQPCSDKLYLGRKPFSLFAVEPRAAQHSTGSRQDVSLLPSSAWEHFACTVIHGIKSGFHKTGPRGKSISLKGCTNHFGAAESIKTCYQCPVVWKLSSGMSCLMPDEN